MQGRRIAGAIKTSLQRNFDLSTPFQLPRSSFCVTFPLVMSLLPAHHCAIGVGHITGKLKKLAALLGMEFARVC
jgi:hypothetical protein